jgi:GNAT superfamily N-acetyltransferase
MSVTVRTAGPEDAAVIYGFIRDLAEYEKLLHEVTASEADIARDLFGPNPRIFCDLAEIDGEPVGFAVWFHSYSTFRGRYGIWLEDLFVRPQARGKGAGKALLAHLAKRCMDEDLYSLDWAVLDWNEPSIAFYDGLGAETVEGWINRHLTGDALKRLAAHS